MCKIFTGKKDFAHFHEIRDAGSALASSMLQGCHTRMKSTNTTQTWSIFSISKIATAIPRRVELIVICITFARRAYAARNLRPISSS